MRIAPYSAGIYLAMARCHRGGGDADRAAAVRLALEGVLTPIASEMRQLATRAAKVGSSCQDDIEYKAVILAEFLRDEDAALRTRLAGSLVSDIRSGACLAAT